ncbi:MAG: tail sheath stabilizer and completion protein [Bacteroidales bacterium]|nr:tail sheath stabilizer and completion protein [Bacteroidales bacterium]
MQYFYHNMIRRYIVAFSHLFSDVKVQRKDETGTLLEEVKVPVIYATKNKMYYELKQHPQDAPLALVNTYLPRMGFFISGMQYDSTRKINNTIDYEIDSSNRLIYTGVPYNFNFDLSILTKTQDDLFQIIEQVCPMFTPDRTITIKELIGIDRDVSINLDTTNFTSIFEYGEDEQRTIGIDFSFTLKGHLYPKIQTDSDVLIKLITMQYTLDDINNDVSVTVSLSQESPTYSIIKTITEN